MEKIILLALFIATASSNVSASCVGVGVPSGIIESGEACDDDNSIPNDGCTNCVVDNGWTCTGPPEVWLNEWHHRRSGSGDYSAGDFMEIVTPLSDTSNVVIETIDYLQNNVITYGLDSNLTETTTTANLPAGLKMFLTDSNANGAGFTMPNVGFVCISVGGVKKTLFGYTWNDKDDKVTQNDHVDTMKNVTMQAPSSCAGEIPDYVFKLSAPSLDEGGSNASLGLLGSDMTSEGNWVRFTGTESTRGTINLNQVLTTASQCTAVCGDGTIATGAETCDDGGDQDGDGCGSSCQVEPGWQCSGGTCSAIQCGDGVRAVGAEGCDDGNNDNGDGCSSTCTVEASFTCSECPKAWINEIHSRTSNDEHDQQNLVGGDVTEFIEVALAKGVDPATVRLALYQHDGTNTGPFEEKSSGNLDLSGASKGSTTAGFTFYTFGVDSDLDVKNNAGYCIYQEDTNGNQQPLGDSALYAWHWSVGNINWVASGGPCAGMEAIRIEGDERRPANSSYGSRMNCKPHAAWSYYPTRSAGVVNDGQEASLASAFTSECRQGTCGNGAVETGEKCDDGNTDRGDGCDERCEVEARYMCIQPDGSVTKSYALMVQTPAAAQGPTETYARRSIIGFTASDCRSSCGDGYVELGHELCDDGNAVSSSAMGYCQNNCRYLANGWYIDDASFLSSGAACRVGAPVDSSGMDYMDYFKRYYDMQEGTRVTGNDATKWNTFGPTGFQHYTSIRNMKIGREQNWFPSAGHSADLGCFYAVCGDGRSVYAPGAQEAQEPVAKDSFTTTLTQADAIGTEGCDCCTDSSILQCQTVASNGYTGWHDGTSASVECGAGFCDSQCVATPPTPPPTPPPTNAAESSSSSSGSNAAVIGGALGGVLVVIIIIVVVLYKKGTFQRKATAGAQAAAQSFENPMYDDENKSNPVYSEDGTDSSAAGDSMYDDADLEGDYEEEQQEEIEVTDGAYLDTDGLSEIDVNNVDPDDMYDDY